MLLHRSGLSKSAIIGSLSDSQLSTLEEAMSAYEGFIRGRIVSTNQQPVLPN